MTTPATDEQIAELEALADKREKVLWTDVEMDVDDFRALIARLRAAEAEAERIRADERERRKPIEDAMARALDVADRLIERSFGTDLDRLAPEWNEAYREVARLRTQGDPNANK